jgi:topoisomerase-4 subunit A
VFREDGTMTVSKIADKAFVGKGIVHINVFKKNDERTVYNMIYRDGTKGAVLIKRFSVTGVTRDKLYDLTKGNKGSEVLYFTANPNGEAEVVTVFHKALPGIRKLQFDVSFGDIAIKGRASQGNIVTKYPVRKIVLAEKGVSTLGARMIWYDDTVQRLNTESRGQYLGEFSADDKILTIMQSGNYKLHNFDLENHFEEDMILIEKLKADKPITAIYLDGEKKEYFVKRFLVEPSDKKVLFISEFEGSQLECVSTDLLPVCEIKFYKNKGKDIANESINLSEFIAVKGLKAKGNRLSQYKIKEINLADPIPVAEEPKEEEKAAFDLERMERLKAIKDNLDEMDSQIKLEF